MGRQVLRKGAIVVNMWRILFCVLVFEWVTNEADISKYLALLPEPCFIIGSSKRREPMSLTMGRRWKSLSVAEQGILV